MLSLERNRLTGEQLELVLIDQPCESLCFLVGYCLCFCSLLYRVTVHVCQARILAFSLIIAVIVLNRLHSLIWYVVQ